MLTAAIQRSAAEFSGSCQLREACKSALETYAAQGRILARDTLHIHFFVHRGANNGHGHIPPDLQSRMDDLHEMLGLQTGQAVIDALHPLQREYPDPVGGRLRFFPKDGKAGATNVRPVPGSHTAQLLEALGK
jgi:hypothetical protein